MTIEQRVKQLEMQMDCLQAAFVQYQKNQVPITEKTDDTANKVVDITPYTESKTAYIDDTEVRFNIAKEGIISVYMVDSEGKNVPHTFEQYNGEIIVSFETRTSLATVTISIQ